MDYLGPHLVANLSRLKAGRGLADQINRAKSKLWDLDTIRSADQARKLLPPHANNYELLVNFLPDPESNANDLQEALLELKAAGEQHDLRVRPLATASAAADCIIGYEEAA